MRHPDEVFSVDALLSRVWPTDAESTAPAIRSCVKRIREKLDDDDVNSLIENIPKVGYRLRPNP
jgi:DNA-binding response OmpR family regulator